MKNLRKMTVLFFVAVTMFTFASCNKEDGSTNPGGGSSAISEANIVGEWGWPSNHEMKHKTIIIKADHTDAGNLIWTKPYNGNAVHGKLTKNI